MSTATEQCHPKETQSSGHQGGKGGPLRDILHSTLTNLGKKEGKQSGMYNRKAIPRIPLYQTSQTLRSHAWMESNFRVQEAGEYRALGFWNVRLTLKLCIPSGGNFGNCMLLDIPEHCVNMLHGMLDSS